MYATNDNCLYADQALPFPEADPNPVCIIVWETGIELETNHLSLPPTLILVKNDLRLDWDEG